MKPTLCDCGHAPSAHGTCDTGYGYDTNGRTYCYDCCAERDIEYMRTHDKIGAYLSGDGRTVSNWPGRPLARVTREAVRMMRGFGGSHERTFVRAVAADGTRWYGSGPGRSMYLRLHKCKGA